ncbi:MAG: hypothetical protein IPN82_08115 [Chitinophagaceae bacterium]|nr:hypothetical protein [Chitinophagaceae bacterium]
MLHLHSVLRWVIPILLLVAVYRSLVEREMSFTAGHRKTGLFLNDKCGCNVAHLEYISGLRTDRIKGY